MNPSGSAGNPNPEHFAELADQFLIAYALQTYVVVPAQLFLVGHAAELYLKAVLLSMEPEVPASKHGHRVGRMLERLQALPSPLLADFVLRPSVFEKYMVESGLQPISAMQEPDYQHYIQHQELYWISKYLADIKYLGTEHKELPRTYGMFIRSANPYWVPFFRELRAQLRWPRQGTYFNHVGTILSRPPPGVHPDSLAFLGAL